jgi:hypothetical protein
MGRRSLRSRGLRLRGHRRGDIPPIEERRNPGNAWMQGQVRRSVVPARWPFSPTAPPPSAARRPPRPQSRRGNTCRG